MGVLSGIFRKIRHCGLLVHDDRKVYRFDGDSTDGAVLAPDLPLPPASDGDISAAVALSPRKLIIVVGNCIYLSSKGKASLIYEGGTVKPLIGSCGKTLIAAINNNKEVHRFDLRSRKFTLLCGKFDAENEKLFGLGTCNSEKHNALLIIYRPLDAISRVCEIDLRTGERNDLNCPSDVMAIHRQDDQAFATGSVSAKNTRQFFEYDFKEKRWYDRLDRSFGVQNQSKDKIFYVGGKFLSILDNPTSGCGNDIVESFDPRENSWGAKEGEFKNVRAVASC